MPELGLGLAALGRPAYINLGHELDVADASPEGMERAVHEVLHAAYDGGVRAFDAARSYGAAEAFLASWLRSRGLSRDDVFVSSKWGYAYTGGWRVDAAEHEVKELSASQLDRQWEETRELLGDHLRLYQIHSATLDSGVLEDAAIRERLAALRERGVLVGLTVTGAGQATTIERAVEVGGFDAVQATWNLHERSSEVALQSAHEAGLRVYVKEGLANGRLTDRGAADALMAVARERGASPDAIALAAVLARPWADVVLSGAGTVAQLRSNLGADDVEWDAELEERLAGLAEDPASYWDARSALPWT
jgi:aryl-alcohol dehydrogenase-like predicted oxidoreductase